MENALEEYPQNYPAGVNSRDQSRIGELWAMKAGSHLFLCIFKYCLNILQWTCICYA